MLFFVFFKVFSNRYSGEGLDAAGSTLTSVMMHLAQTAGPLCACFARPFGQRGTT